MVAFMKPGAYDRCLIALTWLAPLVLIVLNRWQASLDRWYAPPNGNTIEEIHNSLDRDLPPWLDSLGRSDDQLYLVIDPACPCTKPAIERIRSAIRESARNDITMTVIDLAYETKTGDPILRSVLKHLPATPSAIAIKGHHLKYAGPAISGSLCSTTGRVFAVSALQGGNTATAINLIDRGCFCPVKSK